MKGNMKTRKRTRQYSSSDATDDSVCYVETRAKYPDNTEPSSSSKTPSKRSEVVILDDDSSEDDAYIERRELDSVVNNLRPNNYDSIDLMSQGLFFRLLQQQTVVRNVSSVDRANGNSFAYSSSAQISTKRLDHSRYTVGWICALPIEMMAARAMLDEEHLPLPNSDGDHNTYQLGAIGMHNVVMTCLRARVYGLTSATAAAVAMASTYPNSTIRPLLVGIGGGVPNQDTNDIRLGDVVIGTPSPTYPAVQQYDLGKRTGHDVLETAGHLNKPSPALLNALSLFQSEDARRDIRISANINHASERLSGFTRPSNEADTLYEPTCEHPSNEPCSTPLVERQPRNTTQPVIHYGCIASGNQVIKHAGTRDRIASKSSGILCFEMEAAGILDYMPCLVIRGICDYCDAHKLKDWQAYAALTAAAVAKALLLVTPFSRRDQASAAIGLELHEGREVLSGPSFDDPTPLMLGITPTDHYDWDETVKRRRRILMALHFENHGLRRAIINRPHRDTCRWLFRQGQICEWTDPTEYQNNNGFLWIKGKPGTGKSTSMKFLVEEVEEFYSDRKDMVIASFFFSARGEELGRSAVGMYRALLGQIFRQLPSLQSLLDSPKLDSMLSQPALFNVELLKDMFLQLIKALGHRHLVLFIDALDECPESQIRDMVRLLEQLPQLAVQNHLHICFASRHYPHVSLRKSCSFTLELQHGHTQDIIRYLDSEFVLENPRLTADLKKEIFRKSRQIFLWIVLVIQILMREYDHGGIHRLSGLLDEIPAEVGELFYGILTRDSSNLPQLVVAIQWTLYSQRPLQLEELYHAVLYANPTSQLQIPHSNLATKGDMKRFILSCSKGILEYRTARHKHSLSTSIETAAMNSQIQFIHETVREYLLQPAVLQGIWPDFEGIYEGKSHELLKQSCFRYLQQVKQNIPIQARKIDWLRSNEQTYPFLYYSVKHILHHAEQAQDFGISQSEFLESFDYKIWLSFLKHLNLLGSARLPKPWLWKSVECNESSTDTDLALTLALTEREYPRLYAVWINDFKINSSWREMLPTLLASFLLDAKLQQCETLLKKQWGNDHHTGSVQHSIDTILYVLIEDIAKTHMAPPQWPNLCKLRGNVNRILIDSQKDGLYVTGRLNEFLRGAALQGDPEKLEKVLLLGAHVNAKDAVVGNAAIHYILEGYSGIDSPYPPQLGRTQCISILHSYGADLNLKGHWDQTPLHVAVERGADTMVKQLLDLGVSATAMDVKGKTALDYALILKLDTIVRQLQQREMMT